MVTTPSVEVRTELLGAGVSVRYPSLSDVYSTELPTRPSARGLLRDDPRSAPGRTVTSTTSSVPSAPGESWIGPFGDCSQTMRVPVALSYESVIVNPCVRPPRLTPVISKTLGSNSRARLAESRPIVEPLVWRNITGTARVEPGAPSRVWGTQIIGSGPPGVT